MNSRCKAPDTRVRYYTMYPGEYVQDLKTGVDTCDAQGVLDGDIDEFITASIVRRAKENIEKEREEASWLLT